MSVTANSVTLVKMPLPVGSIRTSTAYYTYFRDNMTYQEFLDSTLALLYYAFIVCYSRPLK